MKRTIFCIGALLMIVCIAFPVSAQVKPVDSTAQNYVATYGLLHMDDAGWEWLGEHQTTGDTSGVSMTPAVRGQEMDLTMHAKVWPLGCGYGCDERLKVWIDFDGSGTFDPDEVVINDVKPDMTVPQDYDYQVPIPGDAPSSIWMRAVIILSNRDPAPAGTNPYGDVEDYQITVSSPTTTTTSPPTSTTIPAATEFGSMGLLAAILLTAPGFAYVIAKRAA